MLSCAEMAYMCADSGNLMAIAQQVIQQKQKQQQQQQQHHQQLHHQMAAVNPFGLQPPWTTTTHHFHGFPFSDHTPFSADPFQSEGGGVDLAPEVEMMGGGGFWLSDFGSARNEFDSDEWMESLIGESVTESEEVVGETWKRGEGAGGCGGGGELPALAHDVSLPCSSLSMDINGVLVSDSAIDHGLRSSLPQPQIQPWASLPPLPPPPPPEAAGSHLSPPLPPPEAKPPSDVPRPSLLQSLLECARLADTDPDLAAKSLIRIRDSSSPLGEPNSRAAFYFSEALYHRLSSSSSTPTATPHSTPIPDPSPEDFALCYKTLNDNCPYIKFAHFTANQAILESTDSASRIHIVDFGVIQGVQWAALLQALATRSTGKPKKVRISGIPSLDFPQSSLSATGNRLEDFAKHLDLDLEFIPVPTPIQELSPSSFNIDPDESVAVNFMLQLHLLLGEGSATAAVEHALRLAKSLRPEVVTMGEFELDLNRIGFSQRFANAAGFYSAVFDSLDQAMERESQERAGVERLLIGRQIFGAVGSGGRRRLRMEEKSNWTALMEKCGFEPVQPSQYALSQARILLWNYNYSSRYCLVESSPGFVSLGWDGRSLLTVSAWK